MSILYHFSLLVLVVLWNTNRSDRVAAWPGAGRSHSKDHLDPNTRDWGDYSELQGLGHGLDLTQDREEEEDRGAEVPSSSLAPELDFLADIAGKKRLWVITAPSYNDHYLHMMEKQLEDMEQEGLNCQLAERDTYIVTIIQNAMMEGRITKTTHRGDATVESMDPDTVTKLLHYLELTNQHQVFSMLVLKKNLRISEHFPYPVRVEAILELIDQFPMRKLEKMTRKGSPLRCKVTKKRIVVKKKTMKRKMVLGAQRQRNVTSVVVRQPSPDKKAALKRKIQDILQGRSRFVIRKTPSAAGGASGDKGIGSTVTTDRQEKEQALTPLHGLSKAKEEPKDNRYDLGGEGGKKHERAKSEEDKTVERKAPDDAKSEDSADKKGKGKGKGKKGRKGRGKKSNRETSEKDEAAFKEFLEALRGKRRLMVISTPRVDATLYLQQRKVNEEKHCDLAVRKITVATIQGEGRHAVLSLQHFHLDTEAPFSGLPENIPEPDMISLLRAELGLSSSDLFSMTITDYDIKPNRVFEAPPPPSALLEYIDNFPSRRPERENERKGSACSKDNSEAGNTLLRFMSKRRLLLVSTPSEDDYSFQQQISAFHGQECHMGIRHFALLKMIGSGARAKGTVELLPLNGRSQSEVEPLSRDLINNLREHLKISKDYFSMLVVGKDGNVKTWFPSPVWSLDSIYDLVDSTELRTQEEMLQRSLGIHCPEDRGGGRGADDGGYHDYHGEHAEDSYRYHRGED